MNVTSIASAARTVLVALLARAARFLYKFSEPMMAVGGVYLPLFLRLISTNMLVGLRAMGDIKKGQFIGKYVGELLTPEEAQHRRRMSKAAGKKDIYLFALDKFHDPSSADPRLRREPYEIDGEYMSGPTRFINHSCDPNLRVFAVVNDHANKPVHDLCFFALKDIDRYTELTFDYVDGVDGKKEIGRPRRPSKKESPDPERDGIENECLCGAKNCRRFLWI
jgi:histone-lysine N-methyltransferase SUV39H